MKTLKEMILESVLNEANNVRSYVDNVIGKELKKQGVFAKVSNKIGFTSYSVGKWTVINDGTAIIVKKDGKEVEYFNTPKLDYKKAIEMIQE